MADPEKGNRLQAENKRGEKQREIEREKERDREREREERDSIRVIPAMHRAMNRKRSENNEVLITNAGVGAAKTEENSAAYQQTRITGRQET